MPFSRVGFCGRNAGSRPLVHVSIAGLIVGFAPQRARTRPAAGTAATPRRPRLPECCACGRRGRLVALEPHDGLRLPELQHEHHDADARQRARDVGQLGPDVVRHVELHAGERHAAGDDRRQHFERALAARHHDDEIARDDTEIIAQSRPTMALSASTGRSGDVGERRDRNADGPERHRRGVGEQADAGRVEREKPRPASIAPETATGAPKPAAPSMNAPNEKAMNIACSRRSLVRPPTESLMISNLPVSTARR